jgi:predicted dehydrogenase
MGQNHIRAALSLEMQITRLLDLNAESIEASLQIIREQGVETFTSEDKFFMNLCDHVDLLIIATTASSHFSYLKMGVLSGVKKILCEKPVVNSISQINEIQELIKSFDVDVAVNHQMRFIPLYTEVIALQSLYKMQKLVSMVVSAANFGLGMNVTHYFEAFRLIAGKKIHKISGYLESDLLANPRGREFVDYAGIVLGLNESNQKFFADFSSTAGHGVVVIYNFEKGKIIVDEIQGSVKVLVREESNMELPSNRYGSPTREIDIKIKPADSLAPTVFVIKSLVEGNDYPDFEVGSHAVQTALAAIYSSVNGNILISPDEEELMSMPDLKWA